MINVNLRTLKNHEIPQKNFLYRIPQSDVVLFQEIHEKDRETVYVNYDLKEYQYGIYASEYRSPIVSKQGCKTADVLACVVDEAEKKIYTLIFDVKSNISAFSDDLLKGNAMLTAIKEVRDFNEQIHDELLHKNSFMLYYKDAGYIEYERLGIATKNFESEKFSAVADQLEKLFTNEQDQILSLIELKMKTNLRPYRNEVERLRNFSDGKLKIGERTYQMQIYLLEKTNDEEYVVSVILP